MTRPVVETLLSTRGLAALLMVGLTAACSPPAESGPDTAGTPDTTPADTADGSDTTDADSGETGAGQPKTSLVAIDGWEIVEAANDLMASHRPSSVNCPESAVEREQLQGESTLSISTEGCNYYAVRQPSRAAVDAGDTLQIRVWHYELTHDESAEAHVALALGGDVAWEKSVPLPTDSGALLTKQWEVHSDYPAGTRVDFHLHNHGSNTWNFIEFSKNER